MKNLKNKIATLEKLRDKYYSQLDASDLAELDSVLHEMRKILEIPEKSKSGEGELPLRTLHILDVIVRIVSNINDFMN